MNTTQLFAALLSISLLTGTAHAVPVEEGVRIAFLDSGISCKHLDKDRVEKGENFIFPTQDTDDRVGHGTATAGLVLGSEELGLTGVCPTAVVVPLVCYDTYLTGVAQPGDALVMAKAVREAVDTYHCQIINISMGTIEDAPALGEAVAYAREQGAVVVSAVGNENLTAPELVYYPAAYEGVIGVGAADGDTVAGFSQRTGVDVLAQGVGLETVTNRNALESRLRSGTSFACAYISGVCAALWTEHPDWTARQVEQALFDLARDVAQPGFDADSGYGVVALGGGVPLFSDIAGHWGEESIRFCVERGLFSGVGEGRFDPDGTLDRAMLAVILHRLAGEPEAQVGEGFSDVAQGLWYTAAVAWAAGEGIVQGDGVGGFSPTSPIDRQQAAVMLYRYAAPAEWGGEELLSTFADEEQVVSYARPAMGWACERGILQGRPGESGQLLEPDRPVTRAQLAAMLARFLGLAAE